MNAAPRETPYLFGEDQRLFGMLTCPNTLDAGKPVIVIPNTGVEHHVGPNRLHVQLARALASAGFCVFRCDVGALGDSDPPRGRGVNTSDDLRLALDTLDARVKGCGYVLIGLCSGAHDIHQFGRDDVRVHALMFIDGYTYPTPRFRQLLWTGRLTHPGRLLRKAAARFRNFFTLAAEEAPKGAETSLLAWPPKAETQADYEKLLARRVALSFLFTGDTPWAYLYREQHSDAFPLLRGKAKIWFLPHFDHTLTRHKAREELIALVLSWLQGLQKMQ